MRRTGITGAAQARAAWERDGGRPLAELDALTDAAAEGAVAFARSARGRGAGDLDRAAPPGRGGAGRRRPRGRRGGRRAARGRGRAARAGRGRPGAGRRRRGRAQGPRGGPRAPRERRARGACCSPTRSPSGHGASGRSSCAGCRRASSRASARPSRSSTTTSAGRWRGRPGSCWRPTRTPSSASEGCSTPASPGPRRSSSSASARPGRRATRCSRSVVPRRRPRAVHAGARRAARPAPAGRRHLGAARGADPARAAPGAGGAVAGRRAGPARPARDRRGAGRARRRAGARRPAVWRPSPRAGCAGSSSSCWLPPAPIPTRTRCAAAPPPTACWSGRWKACAPAPGASGWTRRRCRRPRRSSPGRWTPPSGARATAARRAERRALEVDLRRVLAARGGVRARRAARAAGVELRRRARREPALALDGIEITGRVDRLDVDRAAGTALVRDYKHRTVHPQARWEQDGALQVGALPAGGAGAARPRAGRRPLPAARRRAS